jgi:hypothetical protein
MTFNFYIVNFKPPYKNPKQTVFNYTVLNYIVVNSLCQCVILVSKAISLVNKVTDFNLG